MSSCSVRGKTFRVVLVVFPDRLVFGPRCLCHQHLYYACYLLGARAPSFTQQIGGHKVSPPRPLVKCYRPAFRVKANTSLSFMSITSRSKSFPYSHSLLLLPRPFPFPYLSFPSFPSFPFFPHYQRLLLCLSRSGCEHGPPIRTQKDPLPLRYSGCARCHA